MAADMVVALSKTTVDGCTLFGHNSGRREGQGQWLTRTPGRTYASGEKVQTQYLELPQTRRTCTVLGSQSEGLWGYHHGVNEHGVAMGYTSLWTRLECGQAGLAGADLVRLGLERAATARQAVDLLTDLITRHGQGVHPGCPAESRQDTALLVADGSEAFALEASGSHWVYQEIQQVRAMSDVCTIRQDWDRIARGLAGHVIDQGWWPSDGSKIDFAAAVGGSLTADTSALRRWGRATLLLEEQNGHIDAAFIRRLLSDHYEGSEDEVDPLQPASGPAPLCRHEGSSVTSASLVAPLGGLPLAWCALGPPCTSVYLPIFLDAELPAVLGRGEAIHPSGPIWKRIQTLGAHIGADEQRWAAARTAFAQLQARLDIDTDEFLADSAGRRHNDNLAEFQRLAELFVQHTIERFEAVLDGILQTPARRSVSTPGLHPVAAAPQSS